MKLIGIDYGMKRTGVALTDVAGRVAFPHEVFLNDSHLLHNLTVLARKEQCNTFVIGESLNNQGNENPVMISARKLGAALTEAGFRVFFQPEQMTSMQVRRETGMEGPVDAQAAAIIANTFIERQA